MEENKNEDIEILRNKYLKAQLEYMDAIKNNPKYNKIFEKIKLKGTNPSLVWYNLLDKIEDIEEGKINDQNMDEVEKEISVNLTIIQNWAVRNLIEKSKLEDHDKER